MLGELVPCGGGPPIPLLGERLIVGRSSRCDVVLRFPCVSSRHCELTWEAGCWHLRDLGSRNGTAVNGTRCAEMQLAVGDVIGFARQRYSILFASAEARMPSAGPATTSSLTAAGGGAGVSAAAPGKPPTARRALLGRLVPCGGGDPIPLFQPVLVIGRHPSCDVNIRQTTVSSRHCRLEFKQGRWFVEDLKSTNGVKIDGVRTESTWLRPESVLSIANWRYRIVYTPTGEEPEPEENPFAKSLLEKAGLMKQFGSGREPEEFPRGEDEPPRKKWTLDETD